jgi:hypothetical protein
MTSSDSPLLFWLPCRPQVTACVCGHIAQKSTAIGANTHCPSGIRRLETIGLPISGPLPNDTHGMSAVERSQQDFWGKQVLCADTIISTLLVKTSRITARSRGCRDNVANFPWCRLFVVTYGSLRELIFTNDACPHPHESVRNVDGDSISSRGVPSAGYRQHHTCINTAVVDQLSSRPAAAGLHSWHATSTMLRWRVPAAAACITMLSLCFQIATASVPGPDDPWCVLQSAVSMLALLWR